MKRGPVDDRPTDPPTLTVAVSPARRDLIAAIAAMPEEAFGYVLKAPLLDFPQLAKNGGFRPESRTAFAQVAAAALAYVQRDAPRDGPSDPF